MWSWTPLCVVLAGIGILAVRGQSPLSGLPSLDVVPPGFVLQKSVSYQDLGEPPSGDPFEIPFGDPLVAPPAGQTLYTPDGIHTTLAEGSPASGSVWVSWSTGFHSFVQNPQAPGYPTSIYAPQIPDPASVASVVEWGLTAGGPYPITAKGYGRGYIMTYLHDNHTFVSTLLHHVHVTGIPYGIPIYYKCGDPAKELSAEFKILLPTSIRPQTWTYPMRLGVVADVGQTYNSSVTYEHLVADNPDAVVFIGDLAYADDFNDQGGDDEANVAVPPDNLALFPYSNVPLYQTYQPKWETMMRLLQRSGDGAQLPYMFTPGNHEIEQDELLRTFQSYTNRFRSPYEQSYSQDPLYYSLDVGPAHIIMLNQYGGFLPNTTIDEFYQQSSLLFFGNSGGPAFYNGNYPQSTVNAEQLSWFLNDLARVNRAVTPWVIVAWHAPVYNSYFNHYRETDCLRQTVEPFMYNAGVDIVLHGHVHAYERAFQTIDYTLDGCAPRWLTMGDGGNIEGTYKQFAATNCTCPAGNSVNVCPCANRTPHTAPDYCTTLQSFTPGAEPTYAPINGTQPFYSAYREPSYGHGIIDFINSTHALWTWNRNVDSESVISDSVYFVKNTACPNQKPGTPLPSTTPPAATAAPAGTLPPLAPGVPHPNPLTVIGDIDSIGTNVVSGVLNG